MIIIYVKLKNKKVLKIKEIEWRFQVFRIFGLWGCMYLSSRISKLRARWVFWRIYCSDIDTKSIVLPTLKDFIMASPPVSTIEIMDNNEHAEVKDIRVMFDMFKKNEFKLHWYCTQVMYINPKWIDLYL